MSNTSKITPYDDPNYENRSGSGSKTAALTCTGAVAGAAGMALAATAAGVYGLYKVGRWLAVGRQLSREELEEMKAVELEYQKQMGGQKLSEMITLNLHQKHSETLVNLARRLNYKVVSPWNDAPKDAHAPILLQRDSGERLAITRNKLGKLSIHTNSDQGLLHALVRRHAQDRVQEFLINKQMTFKTSHLCTGEMQILAREPEAGQAGGAGEIRAHVNADGTAIVDIDKCRGPRCREIVEQLAEAAGCKVTGMTKKEAWFQLPGEPTKTRVKI